MSKTELRTCRGVTVPTPTASSPAMLISLLVQEGANSAAARASQPCLTSGGLSRHLGSVLRA